MDGAIRDRESLGEVGRGHHDGARGKWRLGCVEIGSVDGVRSVFRGKFLDSMLLARRHENAAESLALVKRFANEGIETADVAVHPAPAQVDCGRCAAGSLTNELKAGLLAERPEERIDVDEPGGGPVRKLTARLLLGAESVDLDRVAFGGGAQAFPAPVEEDDRSIQVIQKRRGRIRAEVREEQIDPLVVDARGEEAAVAIPLLAHSRPALALPRAHAALSPR